MKNNALVLGFYLLLFNAFFAQDIKVHYTDTLFFITNNQGVFIAELNSELIDFNEVNKNILKSDNSDSKLIVTILKMQTDKHKKFQELINLALSYRFIDKIINQHLYDQLKNKHGELKLEKILKLSNE